MENIDYVKKTRKDGTTLIIKGIDYHVAKDMIVNNHYSKKWNSSFGKHNYGIFKDGVLLGVAVYGNLMNPNSAKNIIDSGRVIELNRLWIDDELGHNTESMMLGATFTLLRNNTNYDAIQSFADGRLGCGTIYKASNFKYFGYEESVFYEHVDTKETYHQAPLENTKRPKQFMMLNILKMKEKLRPFVVKTYKYIIPIRKKVKINLKEQPYPEYDIGYRYIENRYPIGTYARLLNMYKAIGYQKGVNLCIKVLKDRYTVDEISSELEKQKENKSYIWFLKEYGNKDGLLYELENMNNKGKVIDKQVDVQTNLDL